MTGEYVPRRRCEKCEQFKAETVKRYVPSPGGGVGFTAYYCRSCLGGGSSLGDVS